MNMMEITKDMNNHPDMIALHPTLDRRHNHVQDQAGHSVRCISTLASPSLLVPQHDNPLLIAPLILH